MPLLAALRDAVGLRRVIVDTYQAVSGTGTPAVDELEAQLRAHVAGEPLTATVYPHQIALNVLPEIDTFLDNGYTREEWKVVAESRKILHLPELPVSCTAVRVPVFVGHSEAVHVETERPREPGRGARAVLGHGRRGGRRRSRARTPIRWRSTAAGSDQIYVGRIRQDASLPDGRGLAFWVVADNLRKGAATNAVEIAELLVAGEDWLRR